MARGLGALARFLVTRPPSTMGTRLRDPDEDGEREMPALGRFLARAEELHRLPLPMPLDPETMEVAEDEFGNPCPDPLELSPSELPLGPAARRRWIEYLNETERQLAAEGEFATVRDVAAKSAENACRLAAIFHVWRHGPGLLDAIRAEDMARGVAVARWFLREARRLLGATGGDGERAADAELLARWLGGLEKPPTLGETLRRAPYRLRGKARRDAAIRLLEEHHWLRREKRDGTTVLVLNPKLEWAEEEEA